MVVDREVEVQSSTGVDDADKIALARFKGLGESASSSSKATSSVDEDSVSLG